jgi:hypothetical protein
MAMPNDADEHHGEPAAASDVADAAPAIEATATSSSIVNDSAREERIKSEPASAPAEAATKPSPGLPRATVLAFRPDERPGAPEPESQAAARASSRAGGRRFAMLAAGLTLAAAIGAITGSAGMAGIERLFVSSAPVPAPAAAPPPAPAIALRHENSDEVRVLKESVAQLKTNVKALSDNVAALRSTINLSTSTANAQFTKITETLDRSERERAERDRLDRERADRERADRARAEQQRPATLTPSPEPTGSVQAAVEPKATAKNPVVEGWSLRKVYGSDSALVEGRYGIVEIEPGDLVPGLGRIQEIRRQDGRWVVVTSRGLVVSSR